MSAHDPLPVGSDPDATADNSSKTPEGGKPKRLVSLDAYRGFIMLAMASGGFGFTQVARRVDELHSSPGAAPDWWNTLWHTLAYQFSHVEWVGCSFWDLIQPSFMFMVGVAMPYSYARRQAEGQTSATMFRHVLARSLILIFLGLFLTTSPVNVLVQIGLGYPFLYLLRQRSFAMQLTAIGVILAGYWFFFYQYTVPEAEAQAIVDYLEHRGIQEPESTRFSGLASHWNKHTNTAAAVDRAILNALPLKSETWRDRWFWANLGGYQILNFVPSLATMIFGLMAGHLLRSSRSDREKLRWLLTAGGLCFVVGLAVDTKIWPIQFESLSWSLCPTVKRIWTPNWAVFSSGWTFWFLAGFYWLIDIREWKKWSFPLVIVGMNSIAIYCMSQLMKPWISDTLEKYFPIIDRIAGWEHGITWHIFSNEFAYAPALESAARLAVLWLICLWMYRNRFFVRI